MNAEEIRAEAIERIARVDYTGWLERVRAKYTEDGETCEHLPWDEQPDEGEWGRDRWRRFHTAAVDALGDMLPTDIETTVSYDLTGAGNDRRMRRFVCPWQEVTDAR